MSISDKHKTISGGEEKRKIVNEYLQSTVNASSRTGTPPIDELKKANGTSVVSTESNIFNRFFQIDFFPGIESSGSSCLKSKTWPAAVA